MPIIVKNIRNVNRVEFDKGRFDNWCVYLHRKGEMRFAPTDTTYFEFFKIMGKAYGIQRVYKDFVRIYSTTDKTIDPLILNQISLIADTYGKDALEMDTWLSVIYAGMIAEENKANMILKKRIKRLGIYQVLIQNLEPSLAARFSIGKNWRELDFLMKAAGF